MAGPKDKGWRLSVLQVGFLWATSILIAFHAGIILGGTAASNHIKNGSDTETECLPSPPKMGQATRTRQHELKQTSPQRSSGSSLPRFPSDMKKLVVGMSQVDRDDFIQEFDFGLPFDKSDAMNNKVLFLYAHESALPANPVHRMASKLSSPNAMALPNITFQEASANCDYLHVVLQDHVGSRRQCTAIIGQYESFHVHRFARLREGKMNRSAPLTTVGRGTMLPSGRSSQLIPGLQTSKAYWSSLQKYLGQLDAMLDKLRPIAKKVAVKRSIVVQVVNFGQSELLLNFICSAKLRGLDLSAILVFATDQETYDLIRHTWNITVVYLNELFEGETPYNAAGHFGDEHYMQMMLTKVYCVHLSILLGYNVLFQDVDIVWYRNPLNFFQNLTVGRDASYDMYFQDDGSHISTFAPYSANTGFYYVRNNKRTVYFFNALLMSADRIAERKSHQIPFATLLQDHASLYELKIKVFSRYQDLFPCGYHYHRQRPYMKDLITGKAHPHIFHMSWTNSKTDKLKFLQQLGEWYVSETCTGKTYDELHSGRSEADLPNVVSDCCLSEPRVVCHYKDRPSKIPCHGSSTYNPNGTSFW